MRAKEFVQRSVREDTTINIPITITIPSDEKEPVVNMEPANDEIADTTPTSPQEPVAPEDKVMVPPLQQEVELEKADAGKDSEVIDQLTQDDEEQDENDIPLAHR